MKPRLPWSPHKLVGAFMAFVVVASILAWYLTLDTLPRTIRIATAEEGGLYHSLGRALATELEPRTGREVQLVPSRGSVANRTLLKEGRAEVAIVQGGAVPTDELAVVAPLYSDITHLIVRVDSDLHAVEDLAGRRVVLGPQGSGMRASALEVLAHYDLTDQIEDAEGRYFLDLLEDDTLDAALVTTGILNEDLQRLLRSARFRLLPIPDAEAIEHKDFFLYRTVLPRGVYREAPSVPGTNTPTIATTAYLVAKHDVSDSLVDALLETLYEAGLSETFPILIPYAQAESRCPMPLHPAARKYFNPPDHIGLLANILESIAAFKELLFALAAGSYLIWDRWRRQKEKELQAQSAAQKEDLDAFLAQTLTIEQAQMQTSDPEKLKDYLDELTRIKLRALRKLTDESLRSDRSFSIFIMQCANLSTKIQFKITQETRGQERKPTQS